MEQLSNTFRDANGTTRIVSFAKHIPILYWLFLQAEKEKRGSLDEIIFLFDREENLGDYRKISPLRERQRHERHWMGFYVIQPKIVPITVTYVYVCLRQARLVNFAQGGRIGVGLDGEYSEYRRTWDALILHSWFPGKRHSITEACAASKHNESSAPPRENLGCSAGWLDETDHPAWANFAHPSQPDEDRRGECCLKGKWNVGVNSKNTIDFGLQK